VFSNGFVTRMTARAPRIVIVGAGIGGLSAALDLSRAGLDVTVVEAQARPGGKIRQIPVGPHGIDAGPTVFTMKWVFDQLFADDGTTTENALALTKMTTLARHAWSESETLDLFADLDQSADAIGRFAGADAAAGYRSFCHRAKITFDLLDASFIRADRHSVV
jgi:1-hydroxycarotenoid 3,4-desaturase